MNPNREHRIPVIVLAAGMSRRMGSTKALLDFGGRPLIARIIESFQAASIDEIIVVTGHEPEKIKSALPEFNVNFVHNDRYEGGGMLSSVQTGVSAMSRDCDAFFLALGDHAPPRPQTLESMIDAWRESDPAIVLPTLDGKHGHPILISSCLAPEILALTASQTLATIVRGHANDSREVIVDDRAILEDIDTPNDYNRAITRWTTRQE